MSSFVWLPVVQNSFILVPAATCEIPIVNSLVKATPTKTVYDIGEHVSLSCPVGWVLNGDVSEIMCSSSLQWSPSPNDIHCESGIARAE